MCLFRSSFARLSFARLSQPVLWLCLLLQRMPALRLVLAAGESAAGARVVSLLPTAAALGATLGAVHTLAGATSFVVSNDNVFGRVGVPIQPVAFSLVGAPTPVLSFAVVGGDLPPGLEIRGYNLGVINQDTVLITGTPSKAGSFSISFDGYADLFGTSSSFGTLTIFFTIDGPGTAPVLSSQPVSKAVPAGNTATLSVAAAGASAMTWQWFKNGSAVSLSASQVLDVPNFGPADAGLYCVEAKLADTSTTSETAILGVTTPNKVVGAGEEVGANIVHANGNVFDQVLLKGAAEAITADFALNQITRTSFIDLNDDIVQVEFSGPGTLSVVLDNATGPALPVNYNQGTSYMKGHAGIVIVGATKDTNVSVFTVGTQTAVNPALFKPDVSYDGIAQIAFIAISSADGEFGAVKAADVNFLATRGFTGLYAPGVTFNGPVFIGDISAADAATPVIVLGGARGETRITGGDLLQPNARKLIASGLTSLQFTAGSDSNGRLLSAQTNHAAIYQGGRDVTSEVVVNP